MDGMSDKDWEALHENFYTADLLSAVDSLDALRDYLNDREHFQPPEIRGEFQAIQDERAEQHFSAGVGRAQPSAIARTHQTSESSTDNFGGHFGGRA